MSDEKSCLTPIISKTISEHKTSTMSTFDKSRRIRIIKNLIYLISLLDFLLHYALMIEMGVLQQIYRTFGKTAEQYSSSIQLCELPIKRYLPFSLSQMSLYILYLSILTLLLSTEAVRKSSFHLYRFHVIIKFIFAMGSLFICTVYLLVNRKMNFIHTSIIIPRSQNETDFTSITMDTCLIYTREKMSINILAILDVFLFFMYMECSKVFAFLQQSSGDRQKKVKYYLSVVNKV